MRVEVEKKFKLIGDNEVEYIIGQQIYFVLNSGLSCDGILSEIHEDKIVVTNMRICGYIIEDYPPVDIYLHEIYSIY